MDRANSYVIGDRATDIQLAENMGINGRYDREALNWPMIGEQLTKRDRYAHVVRNAKRRKLTSGGWIAKVAARLTPALASLITCWIRSLPGGFRIGNQRQRRPLYRRSPHRRRYRLWRWGSIKNCSGDKRGIWPLFFVLPMDGMPCRCAWISLVARTEYKAEFTYQRVGDLSTEMIEHFFRSLSYTMGVTLHLKTKGKTITTVMESLFKAFGRTLPPGHPRGRRHPASSKGCCNERGDLDTGCANLNSSEVCHCASRL